MDKLDKYFLDNSKNLTNKTIAVTGATGSLGYFVCYFLLLQKAKIILVGRNEEKLKTSIKDLNKSFPKASLQYIVCDFANFKDVKCLAEELENRKIDILFNNAGCFHLPIKITDEHDVTFVTNFLSPLYLTEYLCQKNETIDIVQTSSLSYKFSKLNFNDIETIHTKNKTKRYANSKRILTLSSLYLQTKFDNKIFLSHPGVSATGLFSSQKGEFSKFFNKIINPIIKILFMKPKKAALSIVMSIFNQYKKETILAPRGLFQIWGYPKQYKLNFTNFRKFEIKNTIDFIDNFIK